MSEQESNNSLFYTENSQIILKLLPNGYIHVDLSTLPKQRNARQYVIHYKSLNTNRSEALSVSRKEQDVILRKIQLGHLYEIHVCTVDRSNRILASSKPIQIQTKTLDQAPTLRVIKATPDFVWIEWNKSDDTQLKDIQSYKLNIDGETTAVLPSTESQFVINDGEIGRRYIIQLEMIRKDGKSISSIPVSVIWPGVTVPGHHVFINGCQELIICWGNSRSINDGNIQSYIFHLCDSEHRLLKKIGPNPPDCHQIWIKDIEKGACYYYILEIQLANSTKSLWSKPRKIECGRETRAPVLSIKYADSYHRDKLSTMAYHLIKIRDNVKSNRYQEKCESQLRQILSTFANLTGSLRLVLTIESKSGDNKSQSYQLIIDGEESMISIPGFAKEFPLDLPRRDKPYKIAVMVTPDAYQTESNTEFVETSGQFSFFCAHFNQHPAIESCSYLQTLSIEKRQQQPMNQGLLKSPQKIDEIQLYDLNTEQIVQFPPNNKGHRLNVVLFYLQRCVPSMTHLKYFSNYASAHQKQHNFISINCDKDDLDELKKTTEKFQNIQCYTDFLPEEFEHQPKGNDKPLHELYSLDGVPTYFILNFSGRVVWKGHLCIQDQSEYDKAMNHIVAESQQQSCSSGNCELCSYRSMNDGSVDAELATIANSVQSIVNERAVKNAADQQSDKQNRKRRVISMKAREY